MPQLKPSPAVSVVIPTFNRPALLQHALASVARQTFKDYEVIVVQNGGLDTARAVVASFNRQGLPVTYHFTEQAGAANARNLGVKRARGRYIAFLDDDDEWMAGKLEKQVELIEKRPEIGVVASRSWEMESPGCRISLRPAANLPIDFHSLIELDPVQLISSLSGILARRECFETVGGFDTRYRIADDVDWYLRLSRKYRFAAIEEPLFYYHRHMDNASADLDTGWKELIAIIKQLKLQDAELPQSTVNSAVSKYCGYFYREGVDALDERKYGRAAMKFLSALRYDPFIGLRIRWSRFSNPLYRLLKPYFAVAYSFLAALKGKETLS